MALIQRATCGVSVHDSANDRLKMEMVAEVQGLPPQRYSFNVSYKKHVISSYKTNWTPPPTALTNTLVNMSENQFMFAFNEYGRLLAAKLEHKDNETFNPSALENRVFTGGIAFSSDSQRLGRNVHCFPVFDPAQTPRCIVLDKTPFDHFKIVCRFRFQIGAPIPPATARTSWTAIETLVGGRVGQPNELFSATDIQTLTIRLQQDGALQGLLDAERRAIARAQNLRPNPGPSGPPFRSRG